MAFSLLMRGGLVVLSSLIGYLLLSITTQPRSSYFKPPLISSLGSSESWPAYNDMDATPTRKIPPPLKTTDNMALYQRNNSLQRQTSRTSLTLRPKTNDVTKVIFIRIPKTGSRTLDDLVTHQLRPKQFKCFRLQPSTVEYKTQFINKQRGNCFFSAHFRYIDFQWPTPPLVISLARDPMHRLESTYYYSMYGDNEKAAATVRYVNSMRSEMAEAKGGNTTIPTLSECILQDLPFCTDHKRLYATLLYFCGNDPRCSNLSEWTYNQAVQHIDGALAVGLTEEFDDYLRVLEQLVPSLFKGLVTSYTKPSSDGAKRTKATKTKHHKEPLSPEAENKLSKVLELEYRVYNHIKNRFHQLKKELGVI